MDSDLERNETPEANITSLDFHRLKNEANSGVNEFIDTYGKDFSVEEMEELENRVKQAMDDDIPFDAILQEAKIIDNNVKKFMLLAQFAKKQVENTRLDSLGFSEEQKDATAGLYFDALAQSLQSQILNVKPPSQD